MAWSPPAHNAGIVWVSAPGDYATFNSNHTPDGTKQEVRYYNPLPKPVDPDTQRRLFLSVLLKHFIHDRLARGAQSR
jgi:hypothetical protein